MKEWTPLRDQLPEQGQLVDVFTTSHGVRRVVFKDGLWWLPDMSMNIFYMPKWWRAAS